MNKIFLLLFIIIFPSITVAADQFMDIKSFSLSRENKSLETTGKLPDVIEKTHQFSSARMQRILDHESKFEPKIVGGREAPIAEYPWSVAFSYYDSSGRLNSFCGGSLIANRWILTAAHCEVYSTDLAVIGRHDLTNNTGSTHNVKQFIPHPFYNPDTSDNDIAIVELYDDLHSVPKLPIEGNDQSISEGLPVTVIGWGRLTEGGLTSNTLQEVTIPVVGNDTCKKSYPNLTDNMLCAGESQGGKDSCQGDSGGPLLRKEGDSWIQIGVVSFGRGCARPNLYGVYTRVSHYANWISENMQ